MKILFIGKGVSNDGCIKYCNELNINYDYVNTTDEVEYNYKIVVKGPGISYDEPIIKKFIELDSIVITDIEFVYWFCNKYYIGITGSNGKTTTTSLITKMLESKYNAIACGNIGYSIGEAAVNNKNCSHFVCELSSFELKGIKYFNPKIAIITNLNCCHLDYHKTFDDYLLSKKKMIINQKEEDYLIYNSDCINTVNLIKDSKAIKYSFSLKNKADCYIDNKYIYFNNERYFKISKLKEQNISTLGNYLASIITGNILGLSKKEIINGITNFKKSKYRFEYVKKNVINDAKSTNVYSTISAIDSINKPIILISGGLYRNYELNKLDDHLKNIELVVSYGETSNLLYDYFLDKGITCFKCVSLEEAVIESKKYLNNKNILLYSPMFASYDMFTSYEQRGELFNKII